MLIDRGTAEALARGQALFNAHRFWDAHEEWEIAWRVERGDVRRMLQGLIQIAAGWHHVFVTGRTSGAVKVLTMGLEKLETIPDAMAGLALSEFCRGITDAMDAVRRWAGGEGGMVDPAIVPTLASRAARGPASA